MVSYLVNAFELVDFGEVSTSTKEIDLHGDEVDLASAHEENGVLQTYVMNFVDLVKDVGSDKEAARFVKDYELHSSFSSLPMDRAFGRDLDSITKKGNLEDKV